MKKQLFLLLFVTISLFVYSEDKKLEVEAVADKAEINFQEEEFSADGGLKAKYDDIRIKANKIKKVKDENVLIAYEKVLFEQSPHKVEADKVILDMDTKIGKVRDGKSFTDDVYYGGKELEVQFPNKAIAKDAWFTTCDQVVDGKPEDAHYHLSSKKIVIYPGKRIVAYSTFINIGKYPVMWFPFYITSLKKDTGGAPLFPRFGKNEEDGFFVIWGLDYGEQEDKYLNGSAALKFSDRKGLMISSWQNLYTFEKNKNWGKLSLKEVLLFPKGKFKEGDYKQWIFNHEHTYKINEGTAVWNYENKSTNTMNNLKSEELENSIKNTNTKFIRYKLNGTFNKIGYGKTKEYDLVFDVERTNSKNIVQQLIEEEDDTMKKENILPEDKDRELKTILGLRRTNPAYMYYVYFQDVEDLDPGSSSSDTYSYMKEKKFELDLKKYKISPKYSITDKDEWAAIDWNQKEKLITLNDEAYKVYIKALENYELRKAYYEKDPTPENKKLMDDAKIVLEEEEAAYNKTYDEASQKTRPKYDKVFSEKYELAIGPYTLFKTNFSISGNYTKTADERKLNRDKYKDDLGNEIEYYKDTEELYSENEAETASISLNHTSRTLKISGGQTKKKTEKRDGTGINEDFKDLTAELSDTKINLWKAGELNAKYTFSKNWFLEKDQRTRQKYDFTHTKDLIDTTKNPDSEIDMTLNNKATYSIELYDYDIGDRKKEDGTELTEEERKDIARNRLYDSGSNITKMYGDNINLKLGNTDSAYGFSLKDVYSSYHDLYMDYDFKRANEMRNSFDFKINSKKYLGVSTTTNKDYEERENKDAEDFLKTDNETLSLNIYEKLDMNFSDNKSKSRTLDTEKNSYYLSSITNSKTDKYSYKFSDWTLSYTLTENLSENITKDAISTISNNTQNKTYGISFRHGTLINRALNLNYQKSINKLTESSSYNNFIFDFTFTDTRDAQEKKEEEMKTAIPENELSVLTSELILQTAEEKRIQELFDKDRKKDIGFDLMGLGNESKPKADLKTKQYKFAIEELRNNKKYTDDNGFKFDTYRKSLLELRVGLEIQYYRNLFKYKYTQSRAEAGGDYTRKLHYSEGKVYFAPKKNYGWTASYAINFDDVLLSTDDRRIENWKISLGHEIHCTEWALELEKKWNQVNVKYDTMWTFKFSIMAFPEKALQLKKDEKHETIYPEFGI